jgi:hypothetical protein
MKQLLPTDSVDFLLLPRLTQRVKQFASPLSKVLATRIATGLSLADIADVSFRASAKNGLERRPRQRES